MRELANLTHATPVFDNCYHQDFETICFSSVLTVNLEDMYSTGEKKPSTISSSLNSVIGTRTVLLPSCGVATQADEVSNAAPILVGVHYSVIMTNCRKIDILVIPTRSIRPI